MSDFFRSKVLYLGASLFLPFFIMAAFLGATSLYLLIGSVLFTTSVAACLVYFPSLRQAVQSSVQNLTQVDVLTLCIFTIFAMTAAREGYVTFYREFLPLEQRRPDQFYIPLALFRYGGIVAALLAILALDRIDEWKAKPRLPGWPHAILSLLIGIAIAVFFMWRQNYL